MPLDLCGFEQKDRAGVACTTPPFFALLLLKKVWLCLPEAERPPRARGPWSDVGRRGAGEPGPLGLIFVLIPGAGLSAWVGVTRLPHCLACFSMPGSPFPSSALESAVLSCPGPGSAVMPAPCLSSGAFPWEAPSHPLSLCYCSSMQGDRSDRLVTAIRSVTGITVKCAHSEH